MIKIQCQARLQNIRNCLVVFYGLFTHRSYSIQFPFRWLTPITPLSVACGSRLNTCPFSFLFRSTFPPASLQTWAIRVTILSHPSLLFIVASQIAFLKPEITHTREETAILIMAPLSSSVSVKSSGVPDTTLPSEIHIPATLSKGSVCLSRFTSHCLYMNLNLQLKQNTSFLFFKQAVDPHPGNFDLFTQLQCIEFSSSHM